MPTGEPTRILLTGASRGIGAVLAQGLAREDRHLHLVGRNLDHLERVAEELRRRGGRASVHAVDVSDPRAVRMLADSVLSEFGPPHALINNAGRLGPIGPTWQADPTDWWRDLEVNLRGVFLVCHAFLPGMIDESSGHAQGSATRRRIVNFGGGGSVTPFVGVSAYGTSKAAVVRFTETLDLELGDTGVIAFSLSPGLVRTDMTERSLDPSARRHLGDLAERIESGDTNSPMLTLQLMEAILDGGLDRLRGCFLHASHDGEDPDRLAARTDEILRRGERRLVVRGF